MKDLESPLSLGIDLGTSGVKVVLLEPSGTIIGTVSAEVITSHPETGWSEQNARDWWMACKTAVRDLQRNHTAACAAVRSIGLSGQMHGSVLIDRHNECIRPVILWNDARSTAEATWLAETFPAFTDVIGSLPMAGLTAPKLLWLFHHEPDSFERIDCLLSPKDYLLLKLTGERRTDMSDAAGTLYLDVHRRTWFQPMIAATHLEIRQFPRLCEGTSAVGTISASVAKELGLSRKIVVAAGGADNPASAIGLGAADPGDSFVTLGTSAAVVSITDRPLRRIVDGVHGFCHALPDRWYGMGAILCGASALRWVTRVLSISDEQVLLDRVAGAVPVAGSVPTGTPLFLPYLSGERTPHNDPNVRGGFMNLTLETSAASLGYAVLEGVCFALRDAMRAVEKSGLEVRDSSLVGGGAKSDYWAQLMANVMGRELRTLKGSALSAGIGAAKLGFAAIGIVEPLRMPLPVRKTFKPQADRRDELDDRYWRFQGLYPAARSLCN